MTRRAEFMGRIRAEVQRATPLFAGATVSERPARPAERAAALRRELAARWPATLASFQREFERVSGVLHRVPTVEDVPAAVGEIARARGAARLIAWAPAALGFDPLGALRAQGLTVTAMPDGDVPPEDDRRRLRAVNAEAELGLSGADLAIGETGSLVLLSGVGRARSTSLLPPCHVAVFDRSALVETLAQVGVFLEAWHGDGDPAWRGAMINVITGPSRTADIELTLTRGVHGPGEVHAVFVETPFRG